MKKIIFTFGFIAVLFSARAQDVLRDIKNVRNVGLESLEVVRLDPSDPSKIPTRRGIGMGHDFDGKSDGSFNFYIHRWQTNEAFNFMMTNGYSDQNNKIPVLSTLMTINKDGVIVKGNLMVQGEDLVLGSNDGRSIGSRTRQRALVHDHNDQLRINFEGDFEGGVLIEGGKDAGVVVKGKTIIENELFVGGGISDFPSISSNTLDSFSLFVSKSIRSEGIKCDLKSKWGDFVFDNSYKLQTLEEVASYIKENHHLPEIPEAKELETNGIDLVEMSRLQMIKIEELTLHLIALNKELKSVKAELAAKK